MTAVTALFLFYGALACLPLVAILVEDYAYRPVRLNLATAAPSQDDIPTEEFPPPE